MQLSPFTPQPAIPRRTPRFGSRAVPELKGVTHGLNEVFKRITHDRTTEMLLEDFVGFGVLRTWMDWRRGATYGNDQNNAPAAAERLSRETLSILTDNVLAGGVAYFIANRMDRNKQGFSNQFIDFDTLDLFQDVAKTVQAKHMGVSLDSGRFKTEFLAELQTRMSLTRGGDQCRGILEQAWDAGINPSPKQPFAQGVKNWWRGEKDTTILKQATELVEAIAPGRDTYTWALKTQGNKTTSVKLDNLLDDVSRFSQHMQEAARNAPRNASGKTAQVAAKDWAKIATDTIAHTLTTKSRRIPVAMLAAMAATFAVPFVISEATRQWWGIDYYPGEIGLRKPDASGKKPPEKHKSFWERHFPYIAQTLKEGNPVPLALSLLPLPFAMGLFNTVDRRFVKSGAGFFKRLLRSFDFQKARPFTAQQQMASVFALLITSRLWNSRSDNEFRERMVDSFLGWGLWILGTPLIKRALAGLSDRVSETALLNAEGELRSQAEIKNLLSEEMMAKGKKLGRDGLEKTYQRSVQLGIGSTIATMLMLGLVEPWIGIRWTQHNEKQKQAAEAARANKAKPVAPPAPLATGVNHQAFGGYPVRYGMTPPGYASPMRLPYAPTYGSPYGATPQWPAKPPTPRYWA